MNACRRIAQLSALLVFSLFLPSPARADLGTLRHSEELAGCRITVFTSPAPLRAGMVEVKVLVQEGGRSATELKVRVRASQGERRIEVMARGEAPFHVAEMELDQAGSWRIEVEVLEKSCRVEFDVEVAERVPSWQALAPWIAWPIVPILLFTMHQVLVRRSAVGTEVHLTRG